MKTLALDLLCFSAGDLFERGTRGSRARDQGPEAPRLRTTESGALPSTSGEWRVRIGAAISLPGRSRACRVPPFQSGACQFGLRRHLSPPLRSPKFVTAN